MFSSNTSQVSSAANYIEDVFSTYLYTGNASTQTITNNIDLSTYGGLVWIKDRTQGGTDAYGHYLFDTARGATKYLQSQTTAAQATSATTLTAFNNNGFSLGSLYPTNNSGDNYASWTFRKQAKFFDVVTYTGTGVARTIAHNLGSVPGCIIVKRTDTTGAWQVYHRSLANTEYLVLNTGNAKATGATRWNSTTPTSTVFSIGTDATVNANTGTYVAYLFAHDAGGFGTAGTDNVISCGSVTLDASGNGTVNLGYEPQFVIWKKINAASNWDIWDTMRGWTFDKGYAELYADSSAVEYVETVNYTGITSTGFKLTSFDPNGVCVYIAIRRGPMKTPTSGTSVFSPLVVNNSAGTTNTTGFPVDLQIFKDNRASTGDNKVSDRLRGVGTTNVDFSTQTLITNSTAAESANSITRYWDNSGFQTATAISNSNLAVWNFGRAPSFMDVVCATGSSTGQTLLSHNLGVAPEMIIKKLRSSSSNWNTWSSGIPFGDIFDGPSTDGASYTNASLGNTTPPSSTQFQTYQLSGSTYVYYLFASCPGVSKVGSYSGTGATQTISCGFAARFVLIKRINSTGSWWVWDTARGMVSGTDPRIALNSATAETNANWVYTDASGFQIVTTDATVNASGGSYIYLCVA